VTNLVSAADAARRLGVKPATLYAYVSRGTLSRRRSADGRTSLFDAAEIEILARRGRPRRPAGVIDITVESQITEITQDGLRYRGHDVIGLARTRSFEDVAELLWTGTLPETGSPCAGRPRAGRPAASPREAGAPDWQAAPAALEVGRAVQAVLPDGILPLERMQVTVPAMAVTDPLRLHLDRLAVMAAARAIITGMVGCLPAADGSAADGSAPRGYVSGGHAAGGHAAAGPAGKTGPGPNAEVPNAQVPVAQMPVAQVPVAERLWSRLCGRRPAKAMLRTLSAALVLLADHELAASTLAARTAASARADPYAVVSAGLGAVSGTLHGGASLAVEALLSAAHDPGDAPRVVGDTLRRGERLPGFGHRVYRGADPRGTLLLDLVRRAAPSSRKVAVADAIIAEVRRRSLPEPNIDFALGTFTSAAGMSRGAGEAIFAVARTAGWIAHALEAYEAGTLLRPRASYTGSAGPRN
jgi:citrate synthase